MGISASAPWLNFYGDIPHSLDYPDKTVYQMVAETTRKHPDFLAYTFMGKQTTFREFLDRIDAAAKGFYHIGIRKGDRVTICMPNLPQAIDAFYALNRIGAIPSMIHPLSAPQEIKFYLNFSASKAILILDQFFYNAADIQSELENKCEILVAQAQSELRFPLNVLYPITKAGKLPKKLPKDGFTFWTDFLKAGEGTVLPPDDGKSDECAVLLYSGGTTGVQKGVMLSSRNLNAVALQAMACVDIPVSEYRNTNVLTVIPLFHSFGLGIGVHLGMVAGGGGLILMPRFGVNAYANVLAKQHPSIVPGVPTIFEALLKAEKLKKTDLSFLKGVFCGGDHLAPELKKKVDRFLQEHGCTEQIREGYGTTETSSAVCLTPKGYYREGSIGIPMPDMAMKIVAVGTTEEVDPMNDGEICISGPSVMLGYWNNPEETAQVLRRHDDGKLWLHTGDLGCMDTDGFVYFRQRIKRLIITGGHNVFPSQLENVIDGHEKVLISCVIGVKDAYRGQRVKAYVVPMPGIQPTEALRQELMEYFRQNFSRSCMPREIEFREDLPRTIVDKVAYRVLEEEANAAEDAKNSIS